MIDISKIEKRLIFSDQDFKDWFGEVIEFQEEPVGFDIETNGENFPKTELAGFSLYSRQFNKVCYIPINHEENAGEVGGEYCLCIEEIRDNVQKIFNKCAMVAHYGVYDFILMNKLGFKFYEAIDSCLLATALQFQNLSLKDLALEFGLVKYTDVISYKKLMNKLGFPEDHVDFTKVNIFKSGEAFNYAINDSIFTFHLAEILYQKYMDSIGPTAISNIMAQTNSMLLLCESSAKGFYADQNQLNNFIEGYEIEVGALDLKLKSQIRKIMGWV